MKRVTCISLLILCSIAYCFSGTSTANLNLGMNILPSTSIAIVKGDAPSSFSQDGNLAGVTTIGNDQVISTTSTRYSFLIQTNESIASISFAAGPMKRGTDASYIQYAVSATSTSGTVTSTATHSTGATQTISLTNKSTNTTGKRYMAAALDVQAAATVSTPGTNGLFGADQAPNGSYTAVVTVTYTTT